MKKILFILFILLFANIANGQTGIGITTPAVKLHVKSNAATLRLEGTDHTYMELFPQGSTTRYGYIGFPNASSTQLTFMNQFATGPIVFGTNGSNKMFLSSDGKLSIGTITPASTLTVGAADGSVAGEILLNPTSTQYEGGQLIFKRSLIGSTVDWTIDQYGTTSSDARLRIFNGNSENNGLAILENGYLGIGTGTPSKKLHVQSSDGTSVYIESTTADNNGMLVLNANTSQNWSANWHEFMYFQKQGASLGYIGTTSSGTAILYGSNSDYRLKNDLKNYNGLDLINKIQTYDFAWKENGSRMHGVLAHELQEVVPYAVSGTKDELNRDSSPKIQSVDYSKLTPILVKAIQEQDIKIKKQEGKIKKLNDDNRALEQRIINLEKLIKSYINKN
jgi:hypothetical protein